MFIVFFTIICEDYGVSIKKYTGRSPLLKKPSGKALFWFVNYTKYTDFVCENQHMRNLWILANIAIQLYNCMNKVHLPRLLDGLPTCR